MIKLIKLIRRKHMNITKNFLPDNIACDTKKFFPGGQPSIITIHYTGPYPGQTPAQVRDWWISSNGEASAHYIIKDDEVLHCWPDNKVAWHAGCKEGNECSLGIEVIPMNEAGEFSDKSIETLKQLLDTLPRLPLVRHYDWTGKQCPAYYCNSANWQALLNRLDRPDGK